MALLTGAATHVIGADEVFVVTGVAGTGVTIGGLTITASTFAISPAGLEVSGLSIVTTAQNGVFGYYTRAKFGEA